MYNLMATLVGLTSFSRRWSPRIRTSIIVLDPDERELMKPNNGVSSYKG